MLEYDPARCAVLFVVCFYKQKTAYEMLISDWSSDVCSSDLVCVGGQARRPAMVSVRVRNSSPITHQRPVSICSCSTWQPRRMRYSARKVDRKGGGEGKSVSVRVDLGGRRRIKTKHDTRSHEWVRILSKKERRARGMTN